VSDAWHQRGEIPSLSRFTGCERQSAYSAPVKGAYEAYKKLFPCVPFRKLNRRFDRFGSTVAKENFLPTTSRRDFRKFFSNVNNLTVIKISIGIMQKLVTLILYRRNDFRVIVTHIQAH
jgi:hypothetical protein